MLSAVLPSGANTNILPPNIMPPNQQIPSLMSQKLSMPVSSNNDNMAAGVDGVSANMEANKPTNVNPFNTPNNNCAGNNNPFANNINNSNNFSQMPPSHSKSRFSSEPTAGNFLIPDMSKPPPGFMNPSTTAPPMHQQLPPALQQQIAQLNSVQQSNINNDANPTNPSNLNVDIMAVTAAIQLVQQQQQQKHLFQQQMAQQQQQLQGSPFMQQPQLSDVAQMREDELPPPPPSMMTEEDQIPTAAYYDLPAGLMVPLIRLEDSNYKPLDPSQIRLPPPAPQNERLTNALAAFYSMPSHDRPRDT